MGSVPYWVYILEVTTVEQKLTYYVGYTADLTKRITQHRLGKGARYTRGKQVRLGYTETYGSRSDAMRRERELKKLKKQEKAELVRNYSALPKPDHSLEN